MIHLINVQGHDEWETVRLHVRLDLISAITELQWENRNTGRKEFKLYMQFHDKPLVVASKLKSIEAEYALLLSAWRTLYPPPV